MARPTKQGVDYFPLDVHLDNKFKFIEIKFGLEGFAVVIKMFQEIYSQGYFCKWGNDEKLLFSDEHKVDFQKLEEITNECLEREIFNKDLYEKYEILTSRGIQTRYKEIVRRRKDVEVIEEYLLIEGSFGVNDDTMTTSCKQTDGKSTQSKVKESKVKESIDDDTRANEGETDGTPVTEKVSDTPDAERIIGEKFLELKGGVSLSPKDMAAIGKILGLKVPLGKILSWLEEIFDEFNRDRPWDKIQSFVYCQKAIETRYNNLVRGFSGQVANVDDYREKRKSKTQRSMELIDQYRKEWGIG